MANKASSTMSRTHCHRFIKYRRIANKKLLRFCRSVNKGAGGSPRTLKSGGFALDLFGQNGDTCGYLLVLFHAADDDHALRQHQQPSMIHGWVRRVLAESLPLSGARIECEGHR